MSTNATTNQAFFLYSRKSTEAEDRQVLSIDSQVDETKRLAERLGFPIAEVFSEARSAKAPGRPIFNEMMRRIQAGEAAGILCWKLDRLARNPVDGGSLIWAVRQHGIRIVTPTQTFSHADDNIILMYIEFGMAHKFIDDLSRVVKRGLEAKANRGWYPTVAPIGYLNDSTRPKGYKEIITDPERFGLVRKMWDLMLTGGYSPVGILNIATNDWGLRTRVGRPLSRSGVYYLFTNPFYAGSFEYPRGSGRWFNGSHQPIITEAEYDQVQSLLGNKGRPRAVSRMFAYTGLIRCGDCGAMVTAEEKHQLICALCRYKFAHRRKDRCPHCKAPVQAMLERPRPRRPTVLRYVYYHCTRRKDPACQQRSIRIEDLEADLAAYLERMEVSERFQRWVLERLRRSFEEDAVVQRTAIEAREKTHRACVARLENLVRLKTAPANADGSLLSDEEYASQRALLLREKAGLEATPSDTASGVAQGLDLIEEVFEFVRQARTWLQHQDEGTKRLILAVFATEGSNLTLLTKKLRIDAPKPFPILTESIPLIPAAKPRFEPEKIGITKRQQDAFASRRPVLLGPLDDARTYGKVGLGLIRALREWLETSSLDELLRLRGKLRSLFDRVKTSRRAA